MKKVKFAYASCGLSTYVLDDGTWDGTREGAQALPQVDLPYGEDSQKDAEAEFHRLGYLK